MKKLMLSLGATAAVALPALAEGEANADVGQLASDLSGAVQGMLTSVFPVVSSIAVAFAVFWLGRIAIRVIKSWTSASK